MAFQPLGYKFEIRSPSLLSDVKAAIRSRKKGWFDTKTGARGWICGPFICLWLSAFDRYGPMLFGTAREDGMGTSIVGRAGSDLNGLLLMLLMLPFLVWGLFDSLAATSPPRWNESIVFGGLILLNLFLVWMSHKDRREAEPLVRFLHDAVTPEARASRAEMAKIPLRDGLMIDIDGEDSGEVVSVQVIHDALLQVASGGFAILSVAAENYIQTRSEGGDFLIERHPAPDMHFRAVRRDGAMSGDERSRFTFNETRTAFLAFGSGGEMPPMIEWVPMPL